MIYTSIQPRNVSITVHLLSTGHIGGRQIVQVLQYSVCVCGIIEGCCIIKGCCIIEVVWYTRGGVVYSRGCYVINEVNARGAHNNHTIIKDGDCVLNTQET